LAFLKKLPTTKALTKLCGHATRRYLSLSNKHKKLLLKKSLLWLKRVRWSFALPPIPGIAMCASLARKLDIAWSALKREKMA